MRQMKFTAARVAQKGMTLLEILIVLVLLGVVLGVVAPRILGAGDKAKVDATKLQIKQLMGTIDLYKLEAGHVPSPDQGLMALTQPASGSGRGLLQKEDLKDAWGNPIKYVTPGQNGRDFDLISMGADGRDGGAEFNADISSADVR